MIARETALSCWRVWQARLRISLLIFGSRLVWLPPCLCVVCVWFGSVGVMLVAVPRGR